MIRGGIIAAPVLFALCCAVGAEDAPTAVAVVEAQARMADARAAAAAGRFAEARQHVAAAQVLAGGDARIAEAVARLQGVLTTPEPTSDLSAEQRLLVEVRQARAQAEELAGRGRHQAAADRLASAAAAVRARGGLSLALGQELAAIDARIGELRTVGSDADQHLAQRQQRLTASQADQADRAQASAASRGARLSRVQASAARGHLRVALDDARRLHLDHPDDAEVSAVYRDLLVRAHEQRDVTRRERQIALDDELARLTEAELLPIGVDGLPRFPTDWQQRAGQRQRQQDAGVVMPAWEEALRDRLAAVVSVEAEEESAAELIQRLARSQGINVVIDPRFLAQDKRITLRVARLRLENALDWITRSTGTTWSLASSAVYVGDTPPSEPVLAVHDVSALLLRDRDQPGRGRQLGLQSDDRGAGEEVKAATISPEDVVDLLRRSVSPASWNDPANALVIRGSSLFVTAPPAVHRLITDFVRAQESSRSLMVRIECRWLDIRDGFFEEFGVDWSAAGGLLGPYQPGGTTGLYRQGPSSLITGNTRTPVSSLSSIAPTVGSGLSLSTAFLGPTQVQQMLHAVERASKGRVLDAPSLTTLHGVRSSVFSGTQIGYIAGYDSVSSNMDPRIQVLSTGIDLDLRPLVSADRRYVTMEMQPTLTAASFFTERVQGIRVIPSGGNINAIPTVIFGQNLPLMLPNVSVRRAATNVVLPDGGSVLVGGFERAIDEFASTKVPILGNIPYVGRLFGTRARASEHGKLYLLATATIISYDDLEATL